MSEEDLMKFIKKIENLKSMLKSLEKHPERRSQLSNCSNHDQVVKLARTWGYEIGKRWGEKD